MKYSSPTTTPSIHHFDRPSDVPTIPVDLHAIPKIGLVIALFLGIAIVFSYWREGRKKADYRDHLQAVQMDREELGGGTAMERRIRSVIRLDARSSSAGLRIYDIVDPDEFMRLNRSDLKIFLCMQESKSGVYEPLDTWNPDDVVLKQQGMRLFLATEEWIAATAMEEERQRKRR